MFSTNAVNAPVPMTAPAPDGACPPAVAWCSANRPTRPRQPSHSAGFDSWGGMLQERSGRPEGLHYYALTGTTAAPLNSRFSRLTVAKLASVNVML